MTNAQLEVILKEHKLWLNDKNDGTRADLSGVDLSYRTLRNVDLSYAILADADLNHAVLTNTDLSYAILTRANLRSTVLRSTVLRGTILCDTILDKADLSGAKGLLSAADFLEQRFERTDAGYIAYKVFGAEYKPPKNWEIISGATLTETVNPDRCTECGSGINVAPLGWVKKRYPCKGPIWKVLIKWEWLPGVIVPYMTDGKIRCEKVQLLKIVEE